MTTFPLCPQCRIPVTMIQETTEVLAMPPTATDVTPLKRVVYRLKPCGHELREGFYDGQANQTHS